MTAEQFDPLNVNAMLYEEIAQLLKDLKQHRDDIPFKERATIVVYCIRAQSGLMGLRKEGSDDERDNDTGSAVRKYSKAFAVAAHDARRGKARRGLSTVSDDDDDPAN